jgi:hypothetical protein
MKRQQGISLTAVIFIGILALFVVVLAVKTIPSAIEYQAVMKSLNSIVNDARANEFSDADIRKAYSRYAQVNDVKTVVASDLKIERVGGRPIISVSYEKRVPLFSRVSLVIDYSGSTK